MTRRPCDCEICLQDRIVRPALDILETGQPQSQSEPQNTGVSSD